ncbi:DUF86 domain-containing protein [Candidatus Gottesmanbacteria bacterium]|nr:DUF86 domain-containing protein [Candidatus Gottesmanbacteria bacterium]
MSKSPTEYLHHILDEREFLLRESQPITEEQFMYDEVRQRAFARSLEIIGEATKLLPGSFCKKYPNIDWKSFAGLRDKLIHHYFGVDYAIVWDVIKNELPDFQIQLQKMVSGTEI